MFDKIIYSVFAAAAIGALAACTSSPETEDLQSAQVQFRASEISRSSLTTIETIKESPFAVYGDMVSTSKASATPTVVFNGTEVKYTDGAWSYSDPQYWFPGQTYSFVAIHPATPANIDGTPNYENNKLSFQYTYPESYGNAQDILVAAHRRKYAPGNPHAVAFNFAHIFARLNFVAKIDPALGEGNTVTITRLALRNVFDKATYSITPSPIASGTSETDDFVGMWMSMANSNSEDEYPNSPVFDLDFPSLTLTVGETHEFFPATIDPLIVIPQTLDPDHSLEAEISYYITLNGVPQSPKTSFARLYSASASHGRRWLPGLSYSYSFTLGGEGMIIFNTPEVQEWDDTEGGNYVITDPTEENS